MAKSEDFPGQQKPKNPPTWVTGIKQPEELPEPDLKVSVKEMLARQKAENPEETVVDRGSENESKAELVPSLNGVIAEISIDQICVSPYQPRLIFSEAAIEDLANSIAAVGLAKPITVRPIASGKFELVGGERRWRAHKLLGREKITSYIREMDDGMARILSLTDNEGQEALTEYERGKSYSSIIASGAEPSIRALARRVGVNHSIISRCLLLMDLPESIREVLDVYPGLIGGKWARDFIEFSKSEPELLNQAVISMRDQQYSQEHALRWIAKQVADRNKGGAHNKFTDKEISGLGTVRVHGKRLEFRCGQNVNPQLLAEQFEDFLKTLDRSLISND